MLGLGGVLGLYPLGEVELGAPTVPGIFVPHTGAVSATDAADVPSGDAERLGAVSTVSADGAQSEVTTE